MTEVIALVEDDAAIRALLALALEKRGYRVHAYDCYRAALEGVREGRPDLVVTDVRLPDGSGLDLIGRALSPDGAPAPTVIVSGLGEEDDIVRGLTAGAVDYLAKPFTPDQLVARVRAHLARARATATKRSAGRMPLKEGLAFGRYDVLYELGRGGYGAVYLARDRERDGHLVALKIPTPPPEEDGESAALRFVRETYALSRVQDEHVIQVLETGIQEGAAFCALEYVDGESLLARVRLRGPLDEVQTRALARGLLRAAQALERAEVVHRDLKPDNVLLRNGDPTRPVIIDFGLARWRRDLAISSTGFLVGTLAYLAPEIVQGERGDFSSDRFSIGLTLRFALTGREAFPDLKGHELLKALATEPVPPLDVAVSPGFARLLDSLCARSRDERPPSATVALAALDRACEDAPRPRLATAAAQA